MLEYKYTLRLYEAHFSEMHILQVKENIFLRPSQIKFLSKLLPVHCHLFHIADTLLKKIARIPQLFSSLHHPLSVLELALTIQLQGDREGLTQSYLDPCTVPPINVSYHSNVRDSNRVVRYRNPIPRYRNHV